MKKINLPISISDISGIPLYVRIREVLREEIIQGKLPQGQRIPTELALSQRFNVSRMTVKQAITDLIDGGLLYRRQGLGTFVAKLHSNYDHTKLTNFFEQARVMGLEASVEMLARAEMPAEPKISKALALPEGAPVIHMESLRYLNKEPVTLHCVYLPKALFSHLLNDNEPTRPSFWNYLDSEEFEIREAIQKLEARVATLQQAKILKIKIKETALLYEERITYTADGLPLEYAECYSRGDKYSCIVVLNR
ncbi:MAG: GntR family transcriptional regulator [Deltaproteobacteria bacterium]|nr:GntR family transcriptional regulator [Deltaproteobacteria bacterium]